MEFISNSESETIEFGKKLASQLHTGDIVVLTGELGSGKTKLTEGLLSYYGLQNEISSPTFTIVNEHDLPDTKLFHFDVYRIEDIDEFYAIGGEEYFEKGISVIEWGEKIIDALPNDYIHIFFSRNDDAPDKRIIKIEVHGSARKGLDL